MAAVIVDVAEAVKDQLNDHDFDLEFTAVRGNSKQRKTLKELKALTVDVVRVKWSTKKEDRGQPSKLPTIDIFVRQKLGSVNQEQATGEIPNDETDPLVALAESIVELFEPDQGDDDKDGRLDTYEDAAWKSTDVMTGFVNDKFAETRVWQAQIRLTFEV